MQVIAKIVGTYIPLCCLSIPVFGFFALVAAMPVAFLALTGQGAKVGKKGSEK